jgi:light-regulated signal transduction histidine kinase (bacteriophytochrome)
MPIHVLAVLLVSLFLQLSALVLALRLISLTGRRRAWLLIAAAIGLMALRRAITLFRVLSGDEARPPDATVEWVALAISILMVAGIALIQPVFGHVKPAEEQARRLNVELEARVRARTAELESAAREHESFAYFVAHDLRAPLRAIEGFSKILLDRHKPQLAPQTQRYLGLVRDTVTRMGFLIDDLLLLGQVGRQSICRESVAPAELAADVLRDLDSERSGRQVEIRIGELPRCQADPRLLRHVFANLLSNALKFTRHRAVAEIEIGCQGQNGTPVYYVKDNGVGFDMRYADRLFGAFQRLHRAEDFEGTGLGLAIAESVIRRHGGRIWAEAAPDQGATLCFSVGAHPVSY